MFLHNLPLAPGELVATYVHQEAAPGLGKLAAVVVLGSEGGQLPADKAGGGCSGSGLGPGTCRKAYVSLLASRNIGKALQAKCSQTQRCLSSMYNRGVLDRVGARGPQQEDHSTHNDTVTATLNPFISTCM